MNLPFSGIPGIILILAFALACRPLQATEKSLVTVSFHWEERDAEFEEILYLSLGVELGNYGFSTVRLGEESEISTYGLIADYTLRSTEADVHLALFDNDAPESTLSEVEFLLRFDTDFDSVVADAVHRLFSDGTIFAGGDESAMPEIGGLFESELISAKDLLRTEKSVRFQATAAGGAVSFLGGFSDYAKIGITASLDAGAIFLKESWSFAVGARCSFTRALMAEQVTGGPVYFAAMGPEIRFGLGAAQKIKLSAGVCGGPAILLVKNGGDLLAKTVPFADGGVRALFPLPRDFFLGGDLRFQAVFDDDVPIFGISASIGLNKEI